MNTSKFESLTGVTDLRFPEYYDPPADPRPLVRDWLDRAVDLQVREPLALALATADGRGRPSTRMVTVVTLDDEGLLFTTHSTSRKSREIAETGRASGLFYWRETGQQISLNGPVTAVSEERADALWSARPVPLHAMSGASRQSEPLADPIALQARAGQLVATGALPRPERYVGYHLGLEEVEFWCARADRLHHRLLYRWAGDSWNVTRLQP